MKDRQQVVRHLLGNERERGRESGRSGPKVVDGRQMTGEAIS